MGNTHVTGLQIISKQTISPNEPPPGRAPRRTTRTTKPRDDEAMPNPVAIFDATKIQKEKQCAHRPTTYLLLSPEEEHQVLHLPLQLRHLLLALPLGLPSLLDQPPFLLLLVPLLRDQRAVFRSDSSRSLLISTRGRYGRFSAAKKLRRSNQRKQGQRPLKLRRTSGG